MEDCKERARDFKKNEPGTKNWGFEFDMKQIFASQTPTTGKQKRNGEAPRKRQNKRLLRGGEEFGGKWVWGQSL